MNSIQPLVSIGMPVYNGENYINEAIESILNQTYKNIELIISDNASTDRTKEIVSEFIKTDQRITFHQFEKNYGAAKNFNKTFYISKGKYFKWAAHDDLINQNYIEKCVQILEQNEQVGLCHSYNAQIDSKNNKLDVLHYDQICFATGSNFKNYLKFLYNFKFGQDDADIVNGIFRSNILSETKLIAPYNSADMILVAEIIIRSKIYIIKEALCSKRIHEKRSVSANTSNQDIALWFDTSNSKKTIPLITWYIELNRIIKQSDFTLFGKLIAWAANCVWFFIRVVKGVFRRLFSLLS